MTQEKPMSAPGTSSVPQRDPKDQRMEQGRGIRCYFCNQLGHISRRCPDRVSSVNRVLPPRKNCVVEAEINGKLVRALLDSGAQVTVVPARFVPDNAYTGKTFGLVAETVLYLSPSLWVTSLPRCEH